MGQLILVPFAGFFLGWVGWIAYLNNAKRLRFFNGFTEGFGVGLLIFIVSMLIVFPFLGSEEKSKPVAVVSVQPTIPPAKPADYMTIGLTPDQFKAAFNAAAESNQSAFRINMLELQTSKQGVLMFTYPFDSNISVIGTVNRNDGTIRSVSTLAQVVGTRESAVKVPLIMHDMIVATNPTLPAQDSARMALELFKKCVAKPDENFEDIRNGFRYAGIFIKGTGMLFVVDQKR